MQLAKNIEDRVKVETTEENFAKLYFVSFCTLTSKTSNSREKKGISCSKSKSKETLSTKMVKINTKTSPKHLRQIVSKHRQRYYDQQSRNQRHMNEQEIIPQETAENMEQHV